MIKNAKFIFFLISFIVIISCDKEDFLFDLPRVIKIPTLITNDISNITSKSASCSSIIKFNGGAHINASGICYSTSFSPTTLNNTIVSGFNSGSFNSVIHNLLPNTTYYVRAFATNSAGTGYGNQLVFKTLSTIPTITTTPISNITAFTAICGGNILSDGGSEVNSRGVCYSTISNPTISDNYVLSGSGIGVYTTNLSGLLPNKTYYVRAFAQNGMGTAYGVQYTFKTLSTLASVTTNPVTNITESTAIASGNITSDGGSSVTSRGVCWSNTTSTPTISNSRTINGSGTGSFASSITGLSPSTTYYVRSYATNAVGTSYGSVISFTTLAQNLAVGQSYQGGIIAYIFQTGDAGYIAGQTHGLIATPSNQSTGAQWGCSGTSINTSWNFGTGQNNTTLIVNACTTSNMAARICNDLVSGGYSDWYLPSYHELLKLYSNRTVIGGFSSGYYWSSSQYTSDQGICIYFNGGSGYANSKTSALYVRAIREF